MSTRRVQLDMAPRAYERLQRVKDKTEAVSSAEVVRRGLIVYEAVVDAKANGDVVIRRKADGSEQELLILEG